ncbi:hypothetical protein [Amycolatopsis regifaucium]|uniref:Uncharacterized protein n=1 Tax=Amycolatopsis regifaucium TaxID=546365 RepID=A0A154M5J0_9PSEU|nr:hypothetical protein [Amycolatopsis regifaucium]KZB79637.1 hypothetical protein AVL48_14570 [Amycolatopsis regifaucium]OKA10046.1 hypothetical protein ATP06_0206845 [Amycolatopsis regifaucium]SFI63568.1 hypothetical protein SAMN04489731_11218 [Amycolatopsis regifaucium]
MPELRDGEVVRILIPDHPDLVKRPWRALEFAHHLRYATDPDTYLDGEDPWRLPTALTNPALADALEAILQPSWIRRIDDDTAVDDPDSPLISFSTANPTDTGVDALTGGGIGRMGVFVATATRDQLELLAAARDLLTEAKTTPLRSRSPWQQEIADYVDAMTEAEENDEIEASISSWMLMLRLFDIATADTPTTSHRPDRLLDERAKQVRLPDPAATSPADTAHLLGAIDTAATRDLALDTDAADALRRLQTEWHTALYGDKASSGDAILSSYLY